MPQNSGNPWTHEDDDYVKANYQDMSDEDMGDALGRSKFGIRERRYKLDCKLTPRQKAKAEEGMVWERVSIWLAKEDAQEMLDMMTREGSTVEIVTRAGGKRGRNFAVSRFMSKVKQKNMWNTNEGIHAIPKLDHPFNMDVKEPWEVQSAPIHATLGGG